MTSPTSSSSLLTTIFSGLHLRSPVIAASAPPTESLASIVACARAGIGAVITKSIADYRRANHTNIPRRIYKDQRGIWIKGSFASETLTLREGADLIKAARDAIDIPVIASVGVLEVDGLRALDTAVQLAEAGADMIHFDLFYLPQPRANDATISSLLQLFERATQQLDIPFGAKLNIDFPAEMVALAFQQFSFNPVFLLDSIRVAPPLLAGGITAIPNWEGGLECSLFGAWQKPISFRYTRVFADAGFKSICSGGGISSAEDVVEAIMFGATTVQVATQIMLHGFDWISRTTDKLAQIVEDSCASDVNALRGVAFAERERSLPEHVVAVHASVIPDVCQPCHVCTKLVFCEFIRPSKNGYPLILPGCYGCGLCKALCPREGAIRMIPK